MQQVSFILFELRGRINRKTWLVFVIALTMAESLAGLVFRRYLGMAVPLDESAGTSLTAFFFEDRAALLAGLIFLWPLVAVDVKRWHDIGASGWLTLIVYAPVLTVCSLEVSGMVASLSVPGLAESSLLSLFGFVFLIYLIIIGARRGTAGANRFGQAQVS